MIPFEADVCTSFVPHIQESLLPLGLLEYKLLLAYTLANQVVADHNAAKGIGVLFRYLLFELHILEINQPFGRKINLYQHCTGDKLTTATRRPQSRTQTFMTNWDSNPE